MWSCSDCVHLSICYFTLGLKCVQNENKIPFCDKLTSHLWITDHWRGDMSLQIQTSSFCLKSPQCLSPIGGTLGQKCDREHAWYFSFTGLWTITISSPRIVLSLQFYCTIWRTTFTLPAYHSASCAKFFCNTNVAYYMPFSLGLSLNSLQLCAFPLN